MNKYEKLINQAAADVIAEYGHHMERKQINDRMKAAFKKLSNEYSMRDVKNDALTAFVCVMNGNTYISEKLVLTHAERVERGNKKNKYMFDNNLHPRLKAKQKTIGA